MPSETTKVKPQLRPMKNAYFDLYVRAKRLFSIVSFCKQWDSYEIL